MAVLFARRETLDRRSALGFDEQRVFVIVSGTSGDDVDRPAPEA
jgi:hypothetical protein